MRAIALAIAVPAAFGATAIGATTAWGGLDLGEPPVAMAGPDQTVTLGDGVTLNGDAVDDGLPNPPGTLTLGWSEVSGPGVALFANPASAVTTATFSEAGVYILRLSADDGLDIDTDTVTITVEPPNVAPTVNAGADQTLTVGSSASLAGTITDDGLPNPPAAVTAQWSQVSGPGTTVFGTPTTASSVASFPAVGTYVLRLTASDSQLSAFDDVSLAVTAAAVVAPSPARCATAPTIASSDEGGELKLSTTQLKINQAIGAAAVRRANAIQAWLDAGILGTDLCGGVLAPADLDAGIVTTVGPLGPLSAVASPRPLVIPQANPTAGGRFTLTTAQLRTNQRIYAAAVRRSNALKARLEGKLTGGDLVNGKLGRDRLRQDLSITSTTPAATPAAASKTEIPPTTASTATFTPTLAQLRINQKIAIAAVKRTNELRTLLATGLQGANFADGSITAVDLAP